MASSPPRASIDMADLAKLPRLVDAMGVELKSDLESLKLSHPVIGDEDLAHLSNIRPQVESEVSPNYLFFFL